MDSAKAAPVPLADGAGERASPEDAVLFSAVVILAKSGSISW